MIKFEKTQVSGFDAAIRGMRNPLNSWELSDSFECKRYNEFSDRDDCRCADCPALKFIRTGPNEHRIECTAEHKFIIGEEDLKLMHRLALAGDDHGKFARFITVTVDIVAPLYLWKEFDTYKVGTVSNSCSTMHKIHAKEFELDDFSHEHLSVGEYSNTELLISVLDCLNVARELFLETKDKKYWWQMIQLLPSSYNQRRTVQINYQVLHRIVKARKNHKLDEWHVFCDWALNLPYFKAIYGDK